MIPLEQLQRFVDDAYPHLVENTLKKSQKAAWLQWRDDPKGMAARFLMRQKLYGFSRRKGGRRSLPAYVATGAFRNSLAKRKPAKGKNSTMISTGFSIFGGALNFLGQARMRGYITSSATRSVKTVTRGPFTRLVNGQSVTVAAHPMRLVTRSTTSTRAARTYRDEWEYQDRELIDVQRRSDALFLERFRKTALKKNGTLRDNWRKVHPEE